MEVCKALLPLLLLTRLLGGCASDGDEDGDGVFDRRDHCPHTPAGTEVNHMGCALPQYAPGKPWLGDEPVAKSEVIVLDEQGGALFAPGTAELLPAARQQLFNLLLRLDAPGVLSVRVIGHTDSAGAAQASQVLSEQRADSVAQYLISQGLAPRKITSQGRGASVPLADNASAEGRAHNRRVELQLN